MTGPSALAGQRVLIPRGGAWGERVADLVARYGGEGIIAPVIQTRPPRDRAARDRAFADLAAGSYEWVFLTSASSVEQLLLERVRVPAQTRIAAVGRATARAVIDAGFEVDFVPTGRSSAVEMIRQWCDVHDPRRVGRCLVLRSDLAMAAVSDELEVRGYDAEVCIAYRTVGVDASREVVDEVRSGRIGVLLATSTSVVREFDEQFSPVPEGVIVASLGPGTTREARRRGIPIALTSPVQSIDALLTALAEGARDAAPALTPAGARPPAAVDSEPS